MGQRLFQILTENGDSDDVLLTSRSRPGCLTFDLANRSTWATVPKVDQTFWTFPAEPLDLVKDFYESHRDRLGRLVVIGTTGALVVAEPDQSVDETTTLDQTMPRVLGEKYLVENGASLVLAAGIYGPGRSPRQWIRSGRVSPSSKYLNVIHVEDLCQILLAAAKEKFQGSVFIAADGRPYRWEQIFQKLQIPAPSGPTSASSRGQRPSKRVMSEKSLHQLGVKLRFPDVFQGLKSCDPY